MNFEKIRAYCLQKKAVTEGFPFDENTIVFKVMGKMFLLMDINEIEISVNLKCNPELAIALREKYESVQPGYHMNKQLWNTVYYTGEFPEREFWEMIDHSYDEVVQKLSKKTQQELANL
ncbi:MAG: MmcQ/YjbR family DNA-binding protein [Bacteroidetes bacterium]|nr:MmcQ/YjbR family DNA-binding protein [Bacteroidota bacterium]